MCFPLSSEGCGFKSAIYFEYKRSSRDPTKFHFNLLTQKPITDDSPEKDHLGLLEHFVFALNEALSRNNPLITSELIT